MVYVTFTATTALCCEISFELLDSQIKRPLNIRRAPKPYGGCLKRENVLYPQRVEFIRTCVLYPQRVEFVRSVYSDCEDKIPRSELIGVTRTLCNPTHWQLQGM